MARTLEDIDADIREYAGFLKDLHAGRRVQAMEKGDRKISYGSNFTASEDGIRRRLFELKAERAALVGARSPISPIVM